MDQHSIEGNSSGETNDSPLNQMISELRQKFVECYENSPEDFDPIDVENVKTNNFQIKRFLTYNNLNKSQAFDQLIEAMKWRKSYGVKRDFSQLGVEIFQCGGLFIYGQDREERPVFYARVKTHMKIAALEEIVQVKKLKYIYGKNMFSISIPQRLYIEINMNILFEYLEELQFSTYFVQINKLLNKK